MKVKPIVKVNMGGAAAKVAKIAKDERLGLFLANEAASGMDKFVPMRTGALSEFTVIKPFSITYAAPYARYVYEGEGKNFSKNKHPLATAKWDKAYKDAGGVKKLAKAGTAYLRRGM